MMRKALIPALAFVVIAASAHADEQTNEDRLRDALRQAVAQMRAAQDQAAQAQADAQRAQSAQQEVQARLDADEAKLAAGAAKPAAPAADINRLQDALAQATAQNAELQKGLAKWQAAYNQAADMARGKDEEARAAGSGLKADMKALETCKTENAKLTDVAEEILHLYESQSFRSVLLRSYEPIIGRAKVKLENMVQDYDDKIHDQEYVEPK